MAESGAAEEPAEATGAGEMQIRVKTITDTPFFVKITHDENIAGVKSKIAVSANGNANGVLSRGGSLDGFVNTSWENNEKSHKIRLSTVRRCTVATLQT